MSPDVKRTNAGLSHDKAKKAGATAETKRPLPLPVQPTVIPESSDIPPDDGEMDDFTSIPLVVKVKPQDQLDLTPEELEKEMQPRVLYPQNPRAAKNITQFSFKERQYKRNDQIEQTVFHLALDGCIWLKNSPEAIEQREFRKSKQEEERKRAEAEVVEVEIEGDKNQANETQQRTLRNQFNFSDRGSQTFDGVLRERGVSTKPPPTTEFSESVTQWAIYDSYMAEIDSQNLKDALQKNFKFVLDDEPKKKKNDSDPLYSDNMKWSIKLMERIVNQNAENEIYSDFKYFEDKSDVYRDGEGTLLPLWRFASEKSRRKQVTALKWNPKYKDMFAVAFGCYEFLKQGTGVICCYSLKNTRHPEHTFNTDSGVCSLDWHPSYPALLAVGMYDGTVQVFDVRSKNKKPTYSSTVKCNKHADPVWEVRWNADLCTSTLGFYSISCDGRVTCWSLMKNKLEPEEVMELKLTNNRSVLDEKDGTTLTGLAGGTCFDFSKFQEHLFLVGTEEGKIHKCSKAYSGQYLDTYEGHSMAVYTVRWNPYHPRVFISASADWTVRIWDHTIKTAVMTFDLAQAVGDVAWAPYSSTVFTAITSDGIVHVYDLHVNRHERICDQKVVKKAKLTHVSFNNEYPIIIVGDDRGGVNCLKLSPNLRKTAEPQSDGPQTTNEVQVENMDRFLTTVLERVE
eukprot:GHVQ01002626.1.p1 GENE.GHVQ01002626.1~~GHVQ01002626.1.p1  ORF type:complete len:681 (-),score=60.07 GHVQ01002626.1:2414-4456(-)